jgi:hypothetical protein
MWYGQVCRSQKLGGGGSDSGDFDGDVSLPSSPLGGYPWAEAGSELFEPEIIEAGTELSKPELAEAGRELFE